MFSLNLSKSRRGLKYKPKIINTIRKITNNETIKIISKMCRHISKNIR